MISSSPGCSRANGCASTPNNSPVSLSISAVVGGAQRVVRRKRGEEQPEYNHKNNQEYDEIDV